MYGAVIDPSSEPISTREPALRSRIPGSTARAMFAEPSRLVRTTWSKVSTGTSSKRPYATRPAEWTTASTRPNLASTAATAASTARSSATSVGIACAEAAPAARHRSTAAASDSGPRASSTTCSPCSAACSAVARPIPLDAPVTTTTRGCGSVTAAPLVRTIRRRHGSACVPSRMRSERVPDGAGGQLPADQSLDLLEVAPLGTAAVEDIRRPVLGPLRLLQLGSPEHLLRARVPAEVDLVQLFVVGQEDDLRRQQAAGRRTDAVVQLGEEL